jgi:putative ABC transport system substrate-binding protein
MTASDLCAARPKDLLPGGGHPHMKRREFITLLGGVAVGWPLAARAQQAAIPVIGFLSSLSPESALHLTEAFRRGLSEAGYVEGQNVTIDYKWALGKYDRLPELAAELAGRPVAVLITVGGEPAALAAKSVCSMIPIVFMVGRDPVELGLVASYNRAGGNATGINLLNETIEPKRVGILRELLPQARAVLINPTFPPAEMQWREIEAAARTFGMQTQPFRARTDSEIDSAFQLIGRQQIPALIVATDPLFVSRRDNLIALSEQHKVPTMYGFRDIALAGGLISYGVSLAEAYRQVGYYAGRILKGTKAADLPVVQPTKLELVINLKTAKALSLNIPDRLLAIADEVIE